VYLEIKMGLASHFGPWRLGTVPNTTGTTAGTIRNMGATIVAQTDTAVTYADAASSVAMVIPAGALITRMQFITTAAFSSAATITLSIGGTAISTSSTVTNAGSNAVAVAATTGAAALIANVGSTDAIVTYTVGGTSLTTGTGVLVIEYMVRLSDGTYNPTSQTA
jgi:hypothetical protein